MDASAPRGTQFLGTLTIGDFVRRYWRRKPLHVEGGARDLLSSGLTAKAFETGVASMRAVAPERVRARGGRVVFAEAISRHLPALDAVAARHAATLGTGAAWFDAVRTHAPDGIGSHFDHSDNFVLQQSGAKRWTLSPPPPAEHCARRMLNMPGVGAADIDPDRAIVVDLHPGDALYIPLFWVHSGVSSGPSLSVSLVCPALSFQALLLRAVHAIMAERLMGHHAVPVCHAAASDADHATHADVVRKAMAALLAHLSSADMTDTMTARQTAYLAGDP